VSTSMPGWGMNYLTGFVYFIFGRNIFAAQSFCAVFGAATAPMVYFCSRKIFGNIRVAKSAAIAIAVFPAFVIWSSQLLKDGLVIFLLVLAMTMVLQLQEKFNYLALSLLALSLFGILSLRFYIFYMVVIAVAGSFLVGTSNSPQAVIRRTAALVALGLALMYFGVTRNYNSDVEKFGSLERVQASRLDLATSAKSGFGEDVDVSTTEGAISAIPIGFLYLIFAPFPWEATNLRQAITIPEVFLWWSLFPFLISGVWYTLKHRSRNAFPVLLFSLMLTIAYTVFQGNVGTAYRQRTQIQVFLFMFIAVGWTLYLEKRENNKLMKRQHQQPIGHGHQSSISGAN
jgi:4-amino-4-deoxy-L-arabinose transferase-like glycosyltransferase